MPGTAQEIDDLVHRAYGQLVWVEAGDHQWADGTWITGEEALNVTALAGYLGQQERTRIRNQGQRRAMHLLRSLLSAEQQKDLRGRKDFVVTGSRGGTYRIIPKCGRTERVERHGTRWFVREWYCFHDDRNNPEAAMPDADVSIAHLLLLLADEGEFLARANANTPQRQLWNGDYIRRIREARRERAIA